MTTSQREMVHLRNILELFKAGSQIPVRAVEELIAGDSMVDDLLIEVLRSRAVRDESWAPLWAIVALGERRTFKGAPVILACMRDGNNLIHEGVEFALLRLGPGVVDPILQFLEDNPGLEGREHLYAVLAHFRTRRAVDYLVAQIRRDEDCVTALAWALAETREPRAIEAINEAVRRMGAREHNLAEPLKAAASGEDLGNPLLEDWRKHWVWDEDEMDVADEEEPQELPWGGVDESGLDLTPRWYDITCPGCLSRLEYDSREDEVKVLKGKLKA